MLCVGAEYRPPPGVDDVVLDFGEGKVEDLGDVGPLRTFIEWGTERRDDTMAWLMGLPDSFEEMKIDA